MLSAYPACFIKEDTAYSVIFPDLNTATCGDNLEDALSMAVDCLAGYLYSANLEGKVFLQHPVFKILIYKKLWMNWK